MTKSLPAVTIFTLVESVDSQLKTRWCSLDQDDKLLIHEPSGRLDQQTHNTLLPVHRELSRHKRHPLNFERLLKSVWVWLQQPELLNELQKDGWYQTRVWPKTSCYNNVEDQRKRKRLWDEKTLTAKQSIVTKSQNSVSWWVWGKLIDWNEIYDIL